MKFDRQQALEFYRKMLELRTVDDRIVPLKLKDLVMNGFHPYVGQEAVAVGVCSSLKPDDYVISTHRPQGHALAKGATMRAIFAELLGRMGGPSNGLGGPMQWVDVDNNFFCGSIVGSGISNATGFALATQKEGKGRIVACFFGDGASNTGSFHEGLNLAALWQLPVLYVCENNQYGEAMPVKEFVSVPEISRRAASYGIEGRTVDGMSVLAVAEVVAGAVEGLRAGKGPVLLELMTYRYRGHYMGDPENYRTRSEIQQWRNRDPIDSLEARLVKDWGVNEEELEAIRAETEKQAEEAETWALEQPRATLEYAVSNVLVPVAGRNA